MAITIIATAGSDGGASQPQCVTATPETPIICTAQFRGPLSVVLVGAGGNGARVMPPLMQMLRRGDSVAIIDNDIVEDRNLMRQHFAPRDIGQHKATVLAARYARPDRVMTTAFTSRLTIENYAGVISEVLEASVPPGGRVRDRGVVLLGCVDNALARQAIKEAMTYCGRQIAQHTAWIDVGNETRGGQVIMSLYLWPLRIVAGGVTVNSPHHMPALADAMPQLLRTSEADNRPSCGERLDLQSVQVNHMAAACVINCLSWLLLGIPFVAAGAFFSTLNTMQPIRITGVDTFNHVLAADKSFASSE